MKTFKDLGVRNIALELNNNCNFRCRYCPVSIDKKAVPARTLDPEFVKRVFDEIAEDGSLEYVVLNLFGEPLLYPYLREVLEYANKRNIKTRFGTNGWLFTRQTIKNMVDYPPDEVVISVQNFKKHRFEEIKGASIDYDKWLDRIADYLRAHMAADCKTYVQLSIAINPYNNLLYGLLGLGFIEKEELPNYTRSFRMDLDVFIDYFVTQKLDMRGQKNGAGGGTKKFYLYRPYYKINDKISFYLKAFSDWYKFHGYRENRLIDCSTDHVAINADRSLLLCCVDYAGQTSIGRVSGWDIKKAIERNHGLFANRNNSKSGIRICRRCKGAPTRRGVFFRGVYNMSRKFARDISKDVRIRGRQG